MFINKYNGWIRIFMSLSGCFNNVKQKEFL